jgi:hypothetical protein
VLEVALLARVHPKTVYRRIRDGKLETIQFGPRTFHVPEDQSEFLASNRKWQGIRNFLLAMGGPVDVETMDGK